jgi:DNA-binding winged helix-turn-helix (wHTH) protein
MSLAPVPPVAVSTSAPAANPAPPRAALRLVPPGVEARGFALYVGVDEEKARAAGVDLPALVDALRRLTTDLVPTAETYAAVALAPEGAGGRDVDIVRRALSDRATPDGAAAAHPSARRATGVVVDLGRKRLQLDDETAPLTYREFELLQYLLLREGRTVARTELIGALWTDGDHDVPNERTIDVHIRRLRAKLGAYDDIVRTVRGSGYRFDRHADVVIRSGHAPSPDRF